MTPVDYLIEQLQAPCKGIPSHIIEKAKELQKQHTLDVIKHLFGSIYESTVKQYYDENYNSPKPQNKMSFGEICDEDIEKEASNRHYGTNFKNVFASGAKWYREQLKNKQ